MKFWIGLLVLLGLATVQADESWESSDKDEKRHHWAVLVAGSKTYSNYRHQADTAHAYKILEANGIPADHVIHMAYDDIANNRQNPIKGQIFNEPNGVNVYDQTNIDYRGANVTAKQFLAVLTGDKKTAVGPVLESNKHSKVFVFFADHGAPGFICFPDDQYLYADQLHEAFDLMKTKGMFSELVFYLESCESGSMFPYLTKTDKIFAVTASNANKPSYGAYCGADAVVDGTHLNTCLGDLFSVNWMNDTEHHDPYEETLGEQYDRVKAETTMSPVCKFGDFDMETESVGTYEGIAGQEHAEARDDSQWSAAHAVAKGKHLLHTVWNMKVKSFGDPTASAVSSRDVNLYHLTKQLQVKGDTASYDALAQEMAKRSKSDKLFHKVFGAAIPDKTKKIKEHLVSQPKDFECLRFLVDTHEVFCGKFNDYSLGKVKYIVNACETKTTAHINQLAIDLEEECSPIYNDDI